MPTPFQKPPLSISDQLNRLQSLMPDANPADLKILLRHSGYYRLKNHAEALLAINPNLNFSRLKNSLHFDHCLRGIFLDCLEEVELFFRTTINERMVSETNDAFWYLDPVYFSDSDKHKELVTRIWDETQRSREAFIRDYHSKYCVPQLQARCIVPSQKMPPTWMMIEITSFGIFSQLFKILNIGYRKSIALEFGVKENWAKSWFHSLSVTRNICAHHSRFWNKPLRVTPRIPTRAPLFQGIKPESHASIFVVLFFLLEHISGPNSESGKKLASFLSRIPSEFQASMGFTDMQTLLKAMKYRPKRKRVLFPARRLRKALAVLWK